MSAVLEPTRTAVDEPRVKTWSLAEFHNLCNEGHFGDERVELVAGEIYIMPRQDFAHSYALDVLYEFCRELFAKEAWVRYQLPLHMGEDSYLEPDVSVVAGNRDDYQDHPEGAFFVAEVSHGTWKYDRTRKASLYARARIPEYWIVNINQRRIEIHRDPREDQSQPYGYGYGQPVLRMIGESAALLLKPDQPLEVKKLFR